MAQLLRLWRVYPMAGAGAPFYAALVIALDEAHARELTGCPAEASVHELRPTTWRVPPTAVPAVYQGGEKPVVQQMAEDGALAEVTNG